MRYVLLLALAACAKPTAPPKPVPGSESVAAIATTIADAVAERAAQTVAAGGCYALAGTAAGLRALGTGIDGVGPDALKLPDLAFGGNVCADTDTGVEIPEWATLTLRLSPTIVIASLEGAYAAGRLNCYEYEYGTQITAYVGAIIATALQGAVQPGQDLFVEGPMLDFSMCSP